MNIIIFPTKLKLDDLANRPPAGKPLGELHAGLLKLKLEVTDLSERCANFHQQEAVFRE